MKKFMLLSIIVLTAMLLTGCASKYVPPTKGTKNTVELTLPKQNRIGAFGKTPHMTFSTTDDKGCKKEVFILPLKREKSTIIMPTNKVLIFTAIHAGHLLYCSAQIGAIFSEKSNYELETIFNGFTCDIDIKNVKTFKVKSSLPSDCIEK